MGDSLGDRMKSYENVTNTYLTPRLPVIIRVDGKAFHSYTRGLEQPSDARFERVMNKVADTLCDNIQGAVLAYVQSDEISVLAYGYQRYASQVWFEGKVQKLASVSAAIAAAEFTANSDLLWDGKLRPAYFDGRAFALPRCEVSNYFLWRQQDAVRNSIQSLTRSLYSHSQVMGKNASEMQEMCFQKGRNWNDLPTHRRRGRCLKKMPFRVIGQTLWEVDDNIPRFGQSPEYITDLLVVDDERLGND